MAKAMTKRTVDGLVDAARASAKPVFAWCEVLPGFGAKATSGGAAFIYQYRVGGGRGAVKRRLTIGRHGELSVDQAREIARGWAFEVARGVDPAIEARKAPSDEERRTVSDLLDLWQDEGALRNMRTGGRRSPRNVAFDVGKMNAHIRPTLGKTRLIDLTRADVERAHDAIATGRTATAGRIATGNAHGTRRVTGGDGAAAATMRVFSSVCAFGVRRGYLLSNPCEGVKLIPPRIRDRVLSHDEMARLASALDRTLAAGANPMAVAQVRLLLATGARREEVQSLRWDAIDFDNGMWRIVDDKGRAGARPLSRPALAILESLSRDRGSPWVFPRADGGGYYTGLKQVWEKHIRPAAKLEDVTLHTIRHTFATLGALESYPTALLQAALGHRSAATTLRYQHVDVAPAQVAATKVAERIVAAMQGQRAQVFDLTERREDLS